MYRYAFVSDFISVLIILSPSAVHLSLLKILFLNVRYIYMVYLYDVKGYNIINDIIIFEYDLERSLEVSKRLTVRMSKFRFPCSPFTSLLLDNLNWSLFTGCIRQKTDLQEESAQRTSANILLAIVYIKFSKTNNIFHTIFLPFLSEVYAAPTD